ncbi:hypothetical protein C121_14 [Stenotrophomonas phage C121]|uniref:hypothetical protein n=1 Tax=Stenotrophomonas phage C121 TaxID=2914029 RepID=UPI0023293705|nr:hypothetical protein PP752_gp14 [Stenotrophomonas phage C121]UKL14747.1 hypothetical protein C121_14 [Stenotrophomonas phage C121]
MYSKKIAELSKLFDALLKLHTTALRYPHTLRSDTGICYQLTHMNVVPDWIWIHLKRWMRDWPAGTGNESFPIKKPWWFIWGNHGDYFGSDGMWYGSQGKQRRMLLLYMLKRCDELIVIMENQRRK